MLRKYKFPNGYGASVIDHGYGSEKGLFELGVMDALTEELIYDTPITNDVIGWLTQADVDNLLDKIKALPPQR